MDIRKISEIFVQFVYDNNLIPEEIKEVFKSEDGECEWDVRILLNVLAHKGDYKAKAFDRVVTKEMLVRRNIEICSHKAWGDFYKYISLKRWWDDNNDAFLTLHKKCNQFFHNVHKPELEGFVGIIKDLIRSAPVDAEKRNNVLDSIEQIVQMENNFAIAREKIIELKQELEEMKSNTQLSIEGLNSVIKQIIEKHEAESDDKKVVAYGMVADIEEKVSSENIASLSVVVDVAEERKNVAVVGYCFSRYGWKSLYDNAPSETKAVAAAASSLNVKNTRLSQTRDEFDGYYTREWLFSVNIVPEALDAGKYEKNIEDICTEYGHNDRKGYWKRPMRTYLNEVRKVLDAQPAEKVIASAKEILGI